MDCAGAKLYNTRLVTASSKIIYLSLNKEVPQSGAIAMAGPEVNSCLLQSFKVLSIGMKRSGVPL